MLYTKLWEKNWEKKVSIFVSKEFNHLLIFIFTLRDEKAYDVTTKSFDNF